MPKKKKKKKPVVNLDRVVTIYGLDLEKMFSCLEQGRE